MNKTHFEDGYYNMYYNGHKEKAYVDVDEEVISIYTLNQPPSDTLQLQNKYTFAPIENATKGYQATFTKNSFDIDLISIPVKYRFKQADLPHQLNANINAALFFGLRRDIYNINYYDSPIRKSQRRINHFAYSLGLFGGLGNTLINETTTSGKLSVEYDGLIAAQGIAGIIGINNFTIGIAAGIDLLLDKNNSKWIYQGKPYIGVAFGLNLN